MLPPLDAFEFWFSSLAPSHRQDLSAMMLWFLPGFGEYDPDDLDKNGETIRSALAGFKSDRMKAVGALLAVRAYVDFFLRNRDSRETLDTHLASIAIVRQRRVEEGADAHTLELFDKLHREAPFKHLQWRAVSEKWHTLCAAELSDESLNAWWNTLVPHS